MRVGEARGAAVEWVARYAAGEPGYRGAYFSGSSVGLAAGAELPAASDVDVCVVTAAPEPSPGPGKLPYKGVLLEIGRQPWRELARAEDVLATHYLAGSFRTDTAIDDPTGRLRELHAYVAPRFAGLPWVRRRCESAARRIEGRAAAFDTGRPFHEQVTGWLFPTGVTCHLPLIAALRNPTVRLRYPAVRDVLAGYGHAGRYAELLGLLGAEGLGADRVLGHLDALAATFDATARVSRTPYPFSGDITPAARHVAVDGSRELIGRGDHREAMFWIVATLARCHTILAADAPRLHTAHTPAFRAAVADLGIEGPADIRGRTAETVAFLPGLRRLTEDILAANPDITGRAG